MNKRDQINGWLKGIQKYLEIEFEIEINIWLAVAIPGIFHPVLVIERDMDQFHGCKLDAAQHGTAITGQIPWDIIFGQNI